MALSHHPSIEKTTCLRRIVRLRVNENDLRDCFAMFALTGLIMRGDNGTACPERAYEMADAMIEARKAKEEVGIVAVKRSSTTRRSK